MPADRTTSWASTERSFVVLRALAMIGGTIALFLVPHPPEHKTQLVLLAWGFVSYKLLLCLTIWRWPERLRAILLGTVVLDLGFVGCFVWLGGGLDSHFYLLFYLLVALTAAHFGPGMGVGAAAGGGLFYALASLSELGGFGWHHLAGRVATLFLLGGSLGYLSRRERAARAEAERLNAELRDNQARLLRAERLATIGQMSAKVSHEVRNPLLSISLNVELLEDELAGLPESRRADVARLLRAIRSQVDVLSAVTEEYLQFARLPKPILSPAAPGPILEELAEFVREELRARRVRLVLRIADGLPACRLDGAQIRRALLNLVRNAAEAMPEGGTITLRAEVGGQGSGVGGGSHPPPPTPRTRLESLEVTVADTGPGIPAGLREAIFEPFVTRKAGGTGLGLAIARQIAQDHGGTLTCDAAPEGGALFRLSVPTGEGADGE
jgi:signal transduction histidine kinase